MIPDLLWHIAAPRTPPLPLDQLTQNVLDHYDRTNLNQRREGSDWYPAAREWLKGLSSRTNGDYGRSSAVMAALSPMTDWDTNIAQGAHFLMNYDPSTYNPQDPDFNLGGVSGTSNTDRARKVYHSPAGDYEKHLGQKKIWNFYKNFMGDDNAVTIDRHMARAVLGQGGNLHDLEDAVRQTKGGGNGPGNNYDTMADAVRQAAGQRGVTPAAMQAIIWQRARGMTGQSESYLPKPWEMSQPQSGQMALDLQNPHPPKSKNDSYEYKAPIPEYTGRPLDKGKLEPPPFQESPGYNKPWSQPEQEFSKTPSRKERGLVDPDAFTKEASAATRQEAPHVGETMVIQVSSLQYIGPASNINEADDIMSTLDATNLLMSGPITQVGAAGNVDAAAAGCATTVNANSTVGNYALPSYYQAHDALNVPNASLGQPNGVATLNGNSPATIPLVQCPSMGAGYLLGPFGPTALFAASTTTTPVKIADWNIGVQSVSTFEVMCFFSAFVSSNTGYPVIQVGISNGAAAYGSQTVIAEGTGRGGFNDPQVVSTLPVTATTGNTPSSPAGLNGGTYNIWLTAWLFDGAGQTSTLAATAAVANAGVFLIRGAM